MTLKGPTWKRYEVPHLEGSLVVPPNSTLEAIGHTLFAAELSSDYIEAGRAKQQVWSGAYADVTKVGDLAIKIYREPKGNRDRFSAVEGWGAAYAVASFADGMARLNAQLAEQPSAEPSTFRYTTPTIGAFFIPKDLYDQNHRPVHTMSFEEGQAPTWQNAKNGVVPPFTQRRAVYHDAVELAGLALGSIQYDDLDYTGHPANFFYRPFADDPDITEIVKYDVIGRHNIEEQFRSSVVVGSTATLLLDQ